MLTTKQLLDRAKKAAGIESDYRLSQELGVVQSAVTHWRSGRSHPDDVLAQRLAEMAGIDARAVVAELHAARAKTPEAKALWQSIASALRTGVANVAVATGGAMLLLAPSPGGAQAAAPSPTANSPGLYIMSNGKRRRWRAAGRFARLTAIRTLLGLAGAPTENEGATHRPRMGCVTGKGA